MAKKTKTKPRARGQMQPFDPRSLALIRETLRARGNLRELALLAVGVDSLLRSRDLLQLTVTDVTDHLGAVRERFAVTQGKTKKSISVTLTPRTRETLAAFIKSAEKLPGDFLFTPVKDPHGRWLSTAMFRRVIKNWCKIANLDPRRYSGHSLRRTKAAFIYQHTRNVAAVSHLLGHTSLSNTLNYLGVTDVEVGDLALRFEV
jgi:integrase